MFDIAIIGGGASGMVAAINAKRINHSLKICILEQLPRIGKKILATGNGRCNITNIEADTYIYNNPKFVYNSLSKYPPEGVISFFRSTGLLCVLESEGRAYPMSNNASTVLDCLKTELEHLKIEIKTDYKVNKVKKNNDLFIINDDISAKKILIATGGKASPSQGSDGSGYDILKAFGHKIITPYPALVQLKTIENVKMLKGVRVKARIKLLCNDKNFDGANGELLFTDYGLSGIAIMDISQCVRDEKYSCIVDTVPKLKEKEITKFITECIKNNPLNTIENVLSGMMPRKLSQYILKESQIRSENFVSKLSSDDIKNIIYKIKHLKFNITESTGFNNAQITTGGADTNQFNSKTMESKLIKNLYCSGELLDIDAPCGGYNLQWAWSSGLTAGESMAK